MKELPIAPSTDVVRTPVQNNQRATFGSFRICGQLPEGQVATDPSVLIEALKRIKRHTNGRQPHRRPQR